MYAKIFRRILQSSIMAEDVFTRWTFLTFVLLADKEGFVYGTRDYIARMAVVPRKDFDRAVKRLASPDPDSSTPAEDGKRIVEVGQNVWCVVNYPKYRAIRDEEDIRAETRERVRRHRAKEECNAFPLQSVTGALQPVTDPLQIVTPTPEAEADPEAKAEADPTTTPTPSGTPAGGVVVTKVKKSRKRALKPQAANHPEVVTLFEFWKETCNHPRSFLPDPGDLSYDRASSWLEKIGMDECKSVIRGAAADPWEGRVAHDTLDVLFRDSGHVEKFRKMDPKTGLVRVAGTNGNPATKAWYKLTAAMVEFCGAPFDTAILESAVDERTAQVVRMLGGPWIIKEALANASDTTQVKRRFEEAWSQCDG